MKNLYSLTPKYLATITRANPNPNANINAGTNADADASEPTPAKERSAPVRPPRGGGKPSGGASVSWETGSPNSPSESWWSAVLDEEGGERPVSAAPAPRAERPAAVYDWSAARELFESDGITEVTVTGVNRGGLLVEGTRMRGFVPLSHLIGVPSIGSEEDRQAALHQRVGEVLKAKIIEFDPEKGRVVFSERAAQSAPGRRAELLAKVQVGERISGEVTNITNFGVFIDLSGMEGLVHLSEISWGRVHNPADFVRIGQKVDVEVISIDRDQGRIALSLKRLLPDPWATVQERYKPGDKVECTVTHVTNFGAFAALEEGVEGLIHISELSDGSFSHPRNVVSEGDKVTARVISVESPSRRLALSMRPSVLAEPGRYEPDLSLAEPYIEEEEPIAGENGSGTPE